MRTWVVGDASGDAASECASVVFWTPNGLTTGAGRAGPMRDAAKRCGWNAIIVVAATHEKATQQACDIFTAKRARLTRRKTIHV